MSADNKNEQQDIDQAVENTKELDNTIEQEEDALLQAEEDLAGQIKHAQQKAEENWELLLRTKAEMDNLRRRTQKDLENAHKFALEKFVGELLPIIDGMEMGLTVEDASADSLKQGMELTINMMKSAFEKFNVAAINPVNEKFDPELHQAMSMQPSAEVEPNTVIAVMQKGYTLNDRLVRPAMVMVSKAAETEGS
jgi:molecular chaperone GrpE